MRPMRAELRYFLTAVQVLTRIPMPRLRGFGEEWLERGVKYFPLTGALVGAVCAILLFLFSKLWAGMLPALLTITAGVFVTGGLHEDGFADFFDSIGGATREARLSIMKDSRLGAYGVMALGAGLLIKILALAALPVWTGAAALVAAHAGGRFATVGVISMLPYAGGINAAKIKPLGHGITRRDLAIAAALGILPVLLLLPGRATYAAPLAAAGAACLIAWVARRMLGGYTGDVLGAVEQSYEIAFLLGAAACV
jgi:adenosylcobinamide-GDP ribazoletransferase